MGNEFLRKQREARAKGWNRQLRAGHNDMLASLAPGQELGCRATVSGDLPPVGRKLMLQLMQGEIKVRDQNVCIGEVTNPKDELLRVRCPRGFVAGSSRVRSTRDGDRTDEEAIHRGTDHWLPA